MPYERHDCLMDAARKEPTQVELFNEAAGPSLRRGIEGLRDFYAKRGMLGTYFSHLELILEEDLGVLPDLEADKCHYTVDAWAIVQIYREALTAAKRANPVWASQIRGAA